MFNPLYTMEFQMVHVTSTAVRIFPNGWATPGLIQAWQRQTALSTDHDGNRRNVVSTNCCKARHLHAQRPGVFVGGGVDFLAGAALEQSLTSGRSPTAMETGRRQLNAHLATR